MLRESGWRFMKCQIESIKKNGVFRGGEMNLPVTSVTGKEQWELCDNTTQAAEMDSTKRTGAKGWITLRGNDGKEVLGKVKIISNN